MEALLSATAWGGPMMRMGKVLGYIREGYLADILLIDGDPLADITVLHPLLAYHAVTQHLLTNAQVPLVFAEFLASHDAPFGFKVNYKQKDFH